ncbi:MAG: hypothetical protein P9X24_10235 [Candidatus Hatepunaea meridiana]|nr:hypothetical protein [Candidatus Hatepunaea meridiana]
MNDPTLLSQTEAVKVLAKFFKETQNREADLSIHEDICFPSDEWLHIGSIKLHPRFIDASEEQITPLETALRFGFFDCACRKSEDVTEGIKKLLKDKFRSDLNAEDWNKAENNIQYSLDEIARAVVRTGLINPVLDALTLELLPFRRPTTLVVDTSAVLHGGLDFAVRFLCPSARIKIPAVVQMEILNSSDNYFRLRRTSKHKLSSLSRALYEHAKSQGGQRAIIRLELQTDTEIERTKQGSDPLRGVIRADEEEKSLGLERMQRSFADRLIFETTRDQLEYLPPDHRVMLMTCDQGLARMSLSEGIQPFFFMATKYSQISGQIFTGTNFHPFSDEMFSVSLTSLLWELAVTFGSARLVTKDGKGKFEIYAIGKDIVWQPFHSIQDLLWVDYQIPSRETQLEKAEPAERETIKREVQATKERKAPEIAIVKTKRESIKKVKKKITSLKSGSYSISFATLLQLIEALQSKQSLAWNDCYDLLSIRSEKHLDEYRRFLLAGDFIGEQEGIIKLKDNFYNFWNNLIALNLNEVAISLRKIESFNRFINYLSKNRPTNKQDDLPIGKKAFTSYIILAEICGLALKIPEQGVFSTLKQPSPSNFAQMAWSTYQKLRKGEDYILTGDWFEELASHYSVHPWHAKHLLEQTRGLGLLERFVEGSTPETRFEKHALNIIEVIDGRPLVRKIKLYHGDFLISGSASVSLRIEKRGSWD